MKTGIIFDLRFCEAMRETKEMFSARILPLLTKLIRRAGIEPRHNGFRDSYASHRLAILQDASKVAEETGHAPAQLRRSYREIALPDGRLITPQLAKRYFSILPKPV